MPKVNDDQDWSDPEIPCPDGCGDMVVEINKPGSTETMFVDAEPAGKVLIARWWGNDNLPTTGQIRTAVTQHECSGGEGPDPRKVQEQTIEALRDIHERQPPFVSGSATSQVAAMMIEDFAPNDRLRVLCWLVYQVPEEGATDDELEHDLGIKHQTVSARRRDLVKAGLVEDSGRTRQTESDRPATVWVPTKLAFRVVEKVGA